MTIIIHRVPELAPTMSPAHTAVKGDGCGGVEYGCDSLGDGVVVFRFDGGRGCGTVRLPIRYYINDGKHRN